MKEANPLARTAQWGRDQQHLEAQHVPIVNLESPASLELMHEHRVCCASAAKKGDPTIQKHHANCAHSGNIPLKREHKFVWIALWGGKVPTKEHRVKYVFKEEDEGPMTQKINVNCAHSGNIPLKREHKFVWIALWGGKVPTKEHRVKYVFKEEDEGPMTQKINVNCANSGNIPLKREHKFVSLALWDGKELFPLLAFAQVALPENSKMEKVKKNALHALKTRTAVIMEVHQRRVVQSVPLGEQHPE